MSFQHPVYPLTAIVGQERLKLALILNAIDLDIGGVLFTGAKGTGKSSIIRSVSDILPEVETVKGCVFNCKPHDPTNMCEKCRSIFEKELPLPTIRKKMRIVQIPISVPITLSSVAPNGSWTIRIFVFFSGRGPLL